jgi:hypothetical protein
MRRVFDIAPAPHWGAYRASCGDRNAPLTTGRNRLTGCRQRLARSFAAPDAPAESRRQPAGVAGQGDKVGGGLWDSTPPVALRRLCSTTRMRAIPRPLWSRSDALIAHHQKLHRESHAKPPDSFRLREKRHSGLIKSALPAVAATVEHQGRRGNSAQKMPHIRIAQRLWQPLDVSGIDAARSKPATRLSVARSPDIEAHRNDKRQFVLWNVARRCGHRLGAPQHGERFLIEHRRPRAFHDAARQ